MNAGSDAFRSGDIPDTHIGRRAGLSYSLKAKITADCGCALIVFEATGISLIHEISHINSLGRVE